MKTIVTHPHIITLQKEFEVLAERLIQVLEEIHSIQTIINPPIIEQYDKLFRTLEFRLQQKTLDAAELQRREEIFRLKLERGEVITAKTVEIVHRIVSREFIKIRQRLEDTFLRSKQEREKITLQNKKKSQPTAESTQQYRELVKFLHPDSTHSHNHVLTHTQKEQYWHSTQEAYRNQNAKKLRDIFEIVILLAQKQTAFQHEKTTAEMITMEIHKIQQRLHSEERLLNTLKISEPYILKEKIENTGWIQAEEQMFQSKIGEKEIQIQRSTAYLQTIYHGLQLDIHNVLTNDTTFQNDFLEHTYFGNR